MFKQISKVTSKLDVFGTDIGFSYNNSNIFRTNFGAFISIIFFAGMVAFFWNNPEPVEFNSNSFMFGVQISQTTSFIKKPYFNVTLTYTVQSKLANGTIAKEKHPIVLEPCTIDHWIQFKPIIPDIESSFVENTLSDYLCPRKNETLKISGQYLNDYFEYLKFGVVACKNKTFTADDKWKYSCLSFADQQNVLKSESVRFRMMYPNYIVNAGNPSNILTGFLDMLYFSIQPGAMYTTADIYFTNHYVETDQSLLPFEEIEDDKYIVFTLNNYRLQNLVGNYTSMAEFYLRSDFFSIQTTRTFTKVDEFISYIGGFAQVFLLASAYLGIYLNRGSVEFIIFNI